MRRKNILLCIFLLAYAFLVLFGAVHHEPWRDEANVWNNAKEDTISEMIHTMKYAPTPILWTLILTPFARAGLDYFSMNLIHAALAIFAVSLVLFYSKLPILIKILFPFSYYMAYEYAVIARNYVLTVVVLFAIATLYEKRLKNPIVFAILIAMLLQTNFFSLIPGAVLGLFYSIELYKQKKKLIESFAAWVIIGLSVIFTFIMCLPDPRYVTIVRPLPPLTQLEKVLVDSITSSIYGKFISGNRYFLDLLISCLTGFTYLLALFLLRKKRIIFVLATVSLLWLFIVYIFVEQGTLRHYGLLLIYLTFFVWISGIMSGRLAESIARFLFTMLFGFLLFFSIPSTLYVYAKDYRYQFSGARDMANFIRKNNLENRTIVLYAASDGVSLLPYLDKKLFWYPQLTNLTRYHINDGRDRLTWLTAQELVRNAQWKFPDDKGVLFLLSQPLLDTYPGFRLLHESLVARFWGNDTEQFWLYEKEQ